MDNQSSPAQLLFPIIPSTFCPEGTWADVLNSFTTLYLNNGTVNIPYLNEVSPQQIQAINQNILTIQNQLNAVNPQTGSITSITSGFGTYTVTFPTPMLTPNYTIDIHFVATGTPTTTTANWSLSSGTQTTTGFTFFASTTSTDNISSIVWTVTNISAL